MCQVIEEGKTKISKKLNYINRYQIQQKRKDYKIDIKKETHFIYISHSKMLIEKKKRSDTVCNVERVLDPNKGVYQMRHNNSTRVMCGWMGYIYFTWHFIF